MLSPRVVRPQPHDGAASAASSSSTSSRRHMVDRVSEWELGLPSPAELTPVSQPLIPPALAAAFGIGPADAPSPADAAFLHDSPTSHLTPRFDDDYDEEEEDGEEGEGETDDAAAAAVGGGRGRGGKKARMVWTPELHHRFVEAVEHLGEKGAVPKAIVRLMNVDGLTRENVASHLQKYRLYLKRSHPSAASTPPPPPATAPYFPRFGSQPPPHPQEAAVRNGYRAFVSYEKLRFD